MIAAYVLTDLTRPVEAAARAAVRTTGVAFEDLTPVDRRNVMSNVLPFVNESAKVVADDVLELTAARLIANLAHEVTCSATYDDDTGCDCVVNQAFDVVMEIRRELIEQSKVADDDAGN